MATKSSNLLTLHRQLLAASLAFSAVLIFGCGRSHAQTKEISLPTVKEIPMSTVMDTVRKYGQGGAAKESYRPLDFPPPMHYEADENVFAPYIQSRIRQDQFDDIEYIARQMRIKKPKERGGVWFDFAFYSAAGSPWTPDNPGPVAWEDHIAHLKKWVAAYPESATARIALAMGYATRASSARGTDYASEVPDEAWAVFAANNNLAKATLLEAATLKDKDPYWYYLMLVLARDEGWSKAEARELFDQASAFEPGYYHYYRIYTTYLLPRWNGEEGEMEAFAEEILKRLKEPDASMRYFDVVSTYATGGYDDEPSLHGASWPKLKEGYANIERLDGVSARKLNRYAYLAYAAGDKPAAKEALSQLGDDAIFNSEWSNKDQVKAARAWATAP